MMHFTVPGVQNQKCALRWGREKEKTLEKKNLKTKKTQALSHESQKKIQNLRIVKKLPKPFTTHPPGTSTAPSPGFSVQHRPCTSLGGS